MIRQKSPAAKFLSHLLLVTFIAGQIPTAAYADPLPTNPDDYDVPKYQRLLQIAEDRADQEDRKMQQLVTVADQIQANLTASQQHLATIKSRVAKTVADISSIQRENQDLQSETTQLESSLSGLTTQLEKAKQDLASAEAKLAQIQGDLDAANREVAAKQAAYDAKNRELQPLESQLNTKQSGLNTAQSNLSATRSRLSSNKSEKASLEKKLSDLKNSEAPAIRAVDKAKAEVIAANDAVNQAQQAVQSTGVALRQAEERLRAAQSSGADAGTIAKLQAAVEAAKADSQEARAKFAEANNQKKLANSELAAAEKDLADIRASIPQTEKRITDLTSQIAKDEQQVSTLESQVSTLTSEVNELKSKISTLSSEVARLKAELDRVKAQTASIRNQAEAIQAQITAARSSVNSLQAKLDKAKRDIAENRRKIQQNDERLRNLQAALPTLERERDQTTVEVDNYSRQSVQANAAVANQRPYVRDARAAEQQATARFRIVQQNLQNGLAQASRDGKRDGRVAAGREGEIRGTEAGARDGAIAGDREGAEAGRNEGIRVAMARGQADGKSRGTVDGRKAGKAAGASEGASVGANEGHDAGIAEGQAQGRQRGASEGTAEGTRKGHASGEYERGLAEGKASGKARAEVEGNKKGQVDGTKLADKEALGIKLPNVTIPMGSSPLVLAPRAASIQGFASFSGALQSVNSSDSLRLNSGRYPIPAMDREYAESYRETYQTVYDQQYRAAAAAAYERAHDGAYRSSYDREVRKNYDSEYQESYRYYYAEAEKDAYEAAYDVEYKTAYDITYRAEYSKVFDGSYDDAYRVAYQTAYDNARRDTAAADLAKGRKEGDKSGYASNYPTVYANAKAAAYTARKAMYDTNAILQLQNAVSIDGNQDGVNTPGEDVLLNLNVKNIGRVAAESGVTLELSVPTAGLEIIDPATTLPVIPAVSNALIKGVNAIRVRPSTPIGSKESIIATLVSNGEVLGSSKVEITVGTTLSLTLVDIPSKVSASKDNAVRIVVKNLSKKASLANAQVEVVSSDGLSTISTGVLPLGTLVGGQTTELKTSFRFLDAPAPEKLAFQIMIRVGEATFDSKNLTVKSAERFTYNATSKGLLLVNTADNTGLAQQARKAAGLGLDLFDERQEGALKAEVAAKYASKLIIVPEANAKIKSESVASVKAAITKGANVLIGVDQTSAKNAIGAAVVAAAKKNPTRDLLGMKLSERNVFKVDAAKSKILLSEPGSIIGVDGLGTAILISDIVVRSVSDQVKDLLTATATQDSRSAGYLRAVLISELSQEMLDDVAVNGKNFEKNPSKLKLTKLMTILQGSTPEEKRVLGSLHGELEAARAALPGKEARKAAILRLLAPLKAASEGLL